MATQTNEKYAHGDSSDVKMILLVEDDHSIGDVLSQVITQETSYLVTLVPDGIEALKAVQGIKPNLFILDYLLPHMNGLELYDRLHTHSDLADVPALMISARLPERELAQRNIQGMHKPIDLDDFLQAIDNLLS